MIERVNSSPGSARRGTLHGVGIMALNRKRQTTKASLEKAIITATDTEPQFDPSFLSPIRDVVASGLNPSSALELITSLIAESPRRPKETMDRIKMVDKLLKPHGP